MQYGPRALSAMAKRQDDSNHVHGDVRKGVRPQIPGRSVERRKHAAAEKTEGHRRRNPPVGNMSDGKCDGCNDERGRRMRPFSQQIVSNSSVEHFFERGDDQDCDNERSQGNLPQVGGTVLEISGSEPMQSLHEARTDEPNEGCGERQGQQRRAPRRRRQADAGQRHLQAAKAQKNRSRCYRRQQDSSADVRQIRRPSPRHGRRCYRYEQRAKQRQTECREINALHFRT